MKNIKKQRGNILFIILIAVALLGALSAVLTQGGRSGGGADREINAVTASQVTQYAASLKSGYDRMLLGGVARNQIRFINDNSDADFEVQNNIFNPGSFAGVPVQAMPEAIFSAVTAIGDQWTYHAGINTTGIQLNGIGTQAGADDVAVLGPLTQQACAQLNRTVTRGTITDAIRVTGSTTEWTNPGSSIDLTIVPEVANQAYLCIQNSNNDYFYYHLLSER